MDVTKFVEEEFLFFFFFDINIEEIGYSIEETFDLVDRFIDRFGEFNL